MSFGVAVERADKATCPGGNAYMCSGVKMGLGAPVVDGSVLGLVVGASTGSGSGIGMPVVLRACGGFGVGCSGTSMIHRRVNGVRVPRRMSLSFSLTNTSPAEKRTSLPA